MIFKLTAFSSKILAINVSFHCFLHTATTKRSKQHPTCSPISLPPSPLSSVCYYFVISSLSFIVWPPPLPPLFLPPSPSPSVFSPRARRGHRTNHTPGPGGLEKSRHSTGQFLMYLKLIEGVLFQFAHSGGRNVVKKIF